jgi:hypothetical protein
MAQTIGGHLMTDDDELDAYFTPEQRERMEKRYAEIYGSELGTELTPDERLSFQKDFERLAEGFQEIRHEIHSGVQQKISQLAGIHMPKMLYSAEETEKYLESTESSLRQAALYLLYHHWGQKETHGDRYERIAMCDPITGVRMVALSLLGSCFSYTGDGRISRLLASVVLDRDEADDIRLAAYSNLIRVHGYPTEAGSRFVFSFPDDVNWNFVQQCCDTVR